MPSTRTREPATVGGYQVSATTFSPEFMPSATGRISVIYVSYDAAADPLGRSQVVAYLERLAATFSITLVSFEKERPDPQFRTHLESCGIRWRPLRYHKHPPVASTAWDVTAGAIAIDCEP